MMRFFRIHRGQYDLRGPKRAQNFDGCSVRTLIIFKSFKGEAGFCLKIQDSNVKNVHVWVS